MSSNDDSKIAMLVPMGFGMDQALRALKSCGGNIERDIDSLLLNGFTSGGGVAGVANAV